MLERSLRLNNAFKSFIPGSNTGMRPASASIISRERERRKYSEIPSEKPDTNQVCQAFSSSRAPSDGCVAKGRFVSLTSHWICLVLMSEKTLMRGACETREDNEIIGWSDFENQCITRKFALCSKLREVWRKYNKLGVKITWDRYGST